MEAALFLVSDFSDLVWLLYGKHIFHVLACVGNECF